MEETRGEEVSSMREGPTSTTNDVDEEEDTARPQATFRFTVERFTALSESTLSPPTIVRNLPWKIMIMPRQMTSAGSDRSPVKSMGYFLQCNGESESASWSCQASAELRVLNQKDPKQHFTRKISHLFYSKENDWGFSHYMAWHEVCDPEKGFINDDAVTFEVKMTADAPHGVCWDSKKHTGFVGLKNQGATCYMNSLLQVLYFTNSLRKAVYKMPTEADDSSKSVGLALQRVFHDLQFNDKSVGTKKLTKSFGWETLDSFMQHDAQEFLRVLLDKLEGKMKGTVLSGTIPHHFEGKMISFIRCKNVDYTSSREESFYDIQLNIKGKKNIVESFRDYVKTENLDGENKYDAGSHGLQDAEKGIIFSSFPPVLHLHLLRFHYDPVTDSSVKFNDRFEFPDQIDLSEFLKSPDQDSKKDEDGEPMDVDDDAGAKAPASAVDQQQPMSRSEPVSSSSNSNCQYILHAVLVHSGDNHGGHYVVFINPHGNGKWCKFDDDVVSRCTSEEAIQNNFGGCDDDNSSRLTTNAYMLVYIRKSALKDILCEVTEQDIPVELVERLNAEKQLELVKRKEKSEAHLYMVVRLVLEDYFYGHQGNDLYDPEKVRYFEVRLRKQDTLRQALTVIAQQMKCPVEKLRPWPMNHRTNQTYRPTAVDMESDLDKAIIDVAESVSPWTVFLEQAALDVSHSSLPHFDKVHDVILFFKFYDPAKEKIYYMGHMYVSIKSKMSAMRSEMVRRACLPSETQLMLFEEVRPNMLENIEDLEKPLEQVLEELMDGDIIVYQKELTGNENYHLATAKDYFRDLYFKIDITFVDKNVSMTDPGFTLTLSMRTTYSQMVKEVAKHLDVDPAYLQFFSAHTYREMPLKPLRCSYEGTIKEFIPNCRPKVSKRMFYQKLSIPIHELENKRQIKCTFMSLDQKVESELTLYPNKNGTVADLLEEAKRHCKLSPEGSGQLRLLELCSHKIFGVPKLDTLIESLVTNNNRTCRIEEVPVDHVNLTDNEMLVPVVHYQREPYSSFGNPFLLKIREGELYDEVKEKIQANLDIADKEFEKYRVAVVYMGRPKYIDDESTMKSVRLKDFVVPPADNGASTQLHSRPYIGLQHVNKNSKRARYNYMEKAIKIYN